MTRTAVASDDYPEDEGLPLWEVMAHAQGRCFCASAPRSNVVWSSLTNVQPVTTGTSLTFMYSYTTAIS